VRTEALNPILSGQPGDVRPADVDSLCLRGRHDRGAHRVVRIAGPSLTDAIEPSDIRR
jgi:hypothetical protein